MAQYSKFLELLQGLPQTIDLASNELAVDSITVGGASGTNLTKTALDSLISNSHASGSDNQSITAGDGLTGGGSGSTVSLAVGAGSGISVTADAVAVKYDNISIGLDGSGQLESKLATLSGLEKGSGLAVNVDDSTLEIDDPGDVLQVKAGGLSDSHVASDAAIALSKLAALTASRALVSDGSGVISASSVTATELGYVSGVTSAIQTQINNLGSLIENFEFQDSALDYITDNTQAPPSENSGDRYVLAADGGSPHADWDGASAGDIVEFNGTSWDAVTPTTGMMISIDDEASSLRQWSGSAWSQKYFESTTASTGLTKSGFDIQIASSAAGDGLGFSTGTLSVNVDNSSIELNTDALRVKASGVTNDMLAGSIADSKLSQITTASKVAGSAVQLNAAGALEDSTGLKVKVDATTVDINGSNQLYVKSVGTSVSSVYVTLTNNTGSQIDAGAVVILSQSTAGEIILADSDAIATCEGVVGVVLSNIADEASGLVQISGEATVLQDGAFDLGKRVYVSGTAGNATKTAPSAASSVVFLLGHASATNKVILNMSLVGIN